MNEIQENIRYLKKQGSFSHTLFRYVNPGHWGSILRKYFPERFDNLTDYNYSKCFTLRVNVSETDIRVGFDAFRKFIEQNQALFILEMQISVLGPYITYKFLRYYLRENGKLGIKYSSTPFLPEHTCFEERIKEFMRDMGLHFLTDSVLSQTVPGVSLELREDDVTVYNCLFEDTDSRYPEYSDVNENETTHLKKVTEDIYNFYQYREVAYTLSHYADKDFWREQLCEYFDARFLWNVTHFEDEKCFTHWLILSEGELSAPGPAEITGFVRENSILYTFEIQISVMNPYMRYSFTKYFLNDEQIDHVKSESPFLHEHSSCLEQLKMFAEKIKFKILSFETLAKPIPGIFSKDQKIATISSWLFGTKICESNTR